MTRNLLLSLLFLGGCTQLPPMPGDAAAKRFEPVPDRAVIYVARQVHDLNFIAPIMLDDEPIGPTYKGTYMRLVVPAGVHSITGYATDSGSIRLQTDPGGLYFVQQTALGFKALTGSLFEAVDAAYGRSVVLNGTMANEIIR